MLIKLSMLKNMSVVMNLGMRIVLMSLVSVFDMISIVFSKIRYSYSSFAGSVVVVISSIVIILHIVSVSHVYGLNLQANITMFLSPSVCISINNFYLYMSLCILNIYNYIVVSASLVFILCTLVSVLLCIMIVVSTLSLSICLYSTFGVSIGIELMFVLLGILFYLIEGSIRNLFGLLFIGISINLYLFSLGYMLLPLLLLIGILVINIVLYMIKYNSFNLYINNNNSLSSILFTLLMFVMISCVSSSDISSVHICNNIELINFVSIYNSNVLLHVLLILLYCIVLLIGLLSSKLHINYSFRYPSTSSSGSNSNSVNMFYNIVNYLVLNVFLYIVIAALLCYVPIVIRYGSRIHKYSSDIYEVGIGVNNSNSIYNSISNNNIGSYLLYYYLYLFLILDLLVNVLVISYFISVSVSCTLLIVLMFLVCLIQGWSGYLSNKLIV
jgi:hypothetical protein